jgi:glyoxylase-like metal-dependent hydrolase (beta-lactamase superfamily II)
MKTTHVTDNLTQLTRLRFVNAYLVREDDGFTLIDTTIGGAADDLIGAARAAGGEIVRVAMTHGHGDHAGSVDALKQTLGDRVQILMPELDARILGGEQVVEGKLPGGWPKLKTTEDARIKAGDRVGSLEVIASPGHTPGHVAFLDTRDQSLIAGDSYTSYGGVAVPSHFFWRFPLAAMATWDKAKAVESASALAELSPSVLVVGHGPAVQNPRTEMTKAVERARQSLK